MAIILGKPVSTMRTYLEAMKAAFYYKNNLKQFGFDEADFENGGSDKLVDAIVAWGDEKSLRDRN